MNNLRLVTGSLGTALGTAVVLFAGCGGSGSGGGGGSGAAPDLAQVSNGFGQLLPHAVKKLNPLTGQPTLLVIPIRTDADLIANVTLLNPVLPEPQFPPNAILPSGLPGNQFIYAEFDRDIDISSVLDASPGAQGNSGLSGAITLVALDPVTGQSLPVPARVFVNGFTYSGAASGSPPTVPLQHWVQISTTTGLPEPLDVSGGAPNPPVFPGLSFPGCPGYEFTGSANLISPKTIVFVADADGDLSTLETFPANREVKLRVTTAVRGTNGKNLKRAALACTTVGTDVLRPEVLTSPPPLNTPVISPGSGQGNVDPLTTIRVEFTEPVQPLSVGSLPTGTPPLLSPSLAITFGPAASVVSVPFSAKPVSVYDLSTYELVPAFNFPGEGPDDFQCGLFNAVTITVNPGQFQDLAAVANTNLVGANTFFTTGEGPGLVNAPVSPDTIYVGRLGADPGISLIDLNGNGQSTGNPTFDATYHTFLEGNSNFPNNPNVKLQGALMRPPLQPGSCTINGGSAGVFTLTRDSSLNDLLVRSPVLTTVGDMMIGHALDGTFNNGPSPFGCQAGGGNLCAFDGKKLINPVQNGSTMIPAQTGQLNGVIGQGAENLMCWAPHPNPPPLIFPPLCISPYIGGQEPTSIDTLSPNLLGPSSNYFGQPLAGIPPSGLLTPEQNTYFQGPSLPQPTITPCVPYMIRQQIGHYLYVIDRGRREVVVLNSNRMTVVDRIEFQDPTTLAMSPNLNLLAVVNQVGNLVSFVDIDPASSTFHQVVHETVVGLRPRGVAWEPGNEDILVANEGENTMSIISAASLEVRKVISSQLNEPFDIAITPRETCFGLARFVYFGYIINRNGNLAVFESGPNSVNGWGYDDIIGVVPFNFRKPKAIQPDHEDLRSAVWIAHEGPINPTTGVAGAVGVGAVSKIVVESGLGGVLLLNLTAVFLPHFRDIYLNVQVSLGPPDLSGVPVDIAFDDMRNSTGLPNHFSTYSVGASIPINGKQLVRGGCPNPGVFNTNQPRYMFVAVPNPTTGTGVVDVVRVDGGFVRTDTNPFHDGTQSVPAPNVQFVMDYFRQ